MNLPNAGQYEPPRRKRPWWRTAGGIVGIVLGVLGLVVVGGVVLFYVAMSNYGSNK